MNVVKLQWRKQLESQFLEKKPTFPDYLVPCEKGEQWQQALDLFVAEQSVELLPDVITCNASPGEQLSPPSRGEWTRVEKTRTKKNAAWAAVSAGVGAARAA